MNGDELSLVSSCKYLGHTLSHDFNDTNDIQVRLNCFYNSFNTVHRDFKSCNTPTLLYLFNAYCCPEYGLVLWNNKKTFISSSFKAFNIAYNNALKK